MQSDGGINGEVFEIELLGRIVECHSLDDATAIKSANDILLGNDPTPYSLAQLRPLVHVLSRYGQGWAADKLTGLNN